MKRVKNRKSSLLSFLLFLGFPLVLSAQWEYSKLMPFEKNGLWGYMNSKKEVIIEPRFEEAYPLYYGRGRIKQKGKFGYINEAGKIVIKIKYKEASDFSLNGAYVKKNKKTIRIDTLGVLNRAWIMGCGYSAGVSRERCNPIDTLTDHRIIKNSEGLYGIQLKIKTNNANSETEYFLDTIPTIFDTIYTIHKTVVCFVKNDKLGMLSNTWLTAGGQNVLNYIKTDYDEIKLFHCDEYPGEYLDIIAVKKNGLWGFSFLTYLGWSQYSAEQLRFRYRNIVSIENQYIIVEYKKDQFGFIDLKGNEYFLD